MPCGTGSGKEGELKLTLRWSSENARALYLYLSLAGTAPAQDPPSGARPGQPSPHVPLHPQIADVEKWWERLQAHCPATLGCYEAYVRAYALLGNVKKVGDICCDMEHRGLHWSQKVYNWILYAFCQARQPAAVERTRMDMLQAGYGPTVHTYVYLLEFYGMLGDTAMVTELEAELKDQDVLDVFIHCALIKIYGDMKMWERVEAMSRDSEVQGIAQVPMLFHTMMGVYAKAGMVEHALVWRAN